MRLTILFAFVGLLSLGPWLMTAKEGHGGDPNGQPTVGGSSDPTILIPAGLDPNGQPSDES